MRIIASLSVLVLVVAVGALPTCEIDHGATWKDNGYGTQLFFSMDHFLRSDRTGCNSSELILKHQELKSDWPTQDREGLSCARLGAENITLDFAPGSLVEAEKIGIPAGSVKSVTFRAPEGNVVFRTKYLELNAPNVRLENITFVFEEDPRGAYSSRLVIGNRGRDAENVVISGCRFIGEATESIITIYKDDDDDDDKSAVEIVGNHFATRSPFGIRIKKPTEAFAFYDLIFKSGKSTRIIPEEDALLYEDKYDNLADFYEGFDEELCKVDPDAKPEDEGYGKTLFTNTQDASNSENCKWKRSN